MLIGLPISGILIVTTMTVPIMRYLGALMILWPITIPGRALVITSDQKKLYLRRTVATVREDGIYLDPEGGTPTRIRLDWIRRVRRQGDLWAIISGRGQVVFVKATAFPEAARTAAESRIGVGVPPQT